MAQNSLPPPKNCESLMYDKTPTQTKSVSQNIYLQRKSKSILDKAIVCIKIVG